MNELHVTIHNWGHVPDDRINVLLRIALMELSKNVQDYQAVHEYHYEFKQYNIEYYFKWK